MKKTALYDIHVQAGARMVPFAGYEMPVQYSGIKAEHLHTRENAGLFDVSHMGQLIVRGASAANELERLIPLDLDALSIGQQSYSFFTLEKGGLLDDLIIVRIADDAFYLVINASRIQEDLEHLGEHLNDSTLEVLDQQSLLALQGPNAATALGDVFPVLSGEIETLRFMQSVECKVVISGQEIPLRLCRSGYTGEDGFELSVADQYAVLVAAALVDHESIAWVGLGARDSLRLEAGLCLYGHDLDTTISPIEAGLGWSIAKSRRAGGSKAGGFLGSDVVQSQLDDGVIKKRAGFFVDGKAPVREGAKLVNVSGEECGHVTSGGFSPNLSRPILMAYVNTAVLASEELIFAEVRGRRLPLIRSKMPFVPKRS